MNEFLYTIDDFYNMFQVNREEIYGILDDLGLVRFDTTIGEYSNTFAAKWFCQVKDFKIYWSSKVLDELKERIQ